MFSSVFVMAVPLLCKYRFARHSSSEQKGTGEINGNFLCKQNIFSARFIGRRRRLRPPFINVRVSKLPRHFLSIVSCRRRKFILLANLIPANILCPASPCPPPASYCYTLYAIVFGARRLVAQHLPPHRHGSENRLSVKVV